MARKWPARRKTRPELAGKAFTPIDVVIIHDEPFMNDETGGGLRAHFGERLRICDFSSRSLEWYVENYRSGTDIGQRFRSALDKYYKGLENYMHQWHNYENFIVPFGRTYRGLRISQVRDKEWFRWIQWKDDLKEYRLFYSAVQLWLRNPRHYELNRDLGDRLSRTEYDDDLDLHWNGERSPSAVSSDDDERTLSDNSFIVSDSDGSGNDETSDTNADNSSAESDDDNASDSSSPPSPLPTPMRTRSSMRLRSAAKLHHDDRASDISSRSSSRRPNTTPTRKSKRKHLDRSSSESDESTLETPTKRRLRSRDSSADTSPKKIDCEQLGRNFRVNKYSPSKGDDSEEDASDLESSDENAGSTSASSIEPVVRRNPPRRARRTTSQHSTESESNDEDEQMLTSEVDSSANESESGIMLKFPKTRRRSTFRIVLSGNNSENDQEQEEQSIGIAHQTGQDQVDPLSEVVKSAPKCVYGYRASERYPTPACTNPIIISDSESEREVSIEGGQGYGSGFHESPRCLAVPALTTPAPIIISDTESDYSGEQ
ncbi:hypothetical protein EV360DRAFT_86995 [Lentinula raphanica]|nr:hypothetical protein EV360DRAFT_86995 [Lentinula raphanica]